MNRRRLMKLLGASMLASPVAAQAQEAAYPSRPIRLIVPFAPGGSVDITARLVANYLSKELGQPVMVENRTGAGGRVGAAWVANATPDGYTLLAGSSGSLTALEAIARTLPYKIERDFVPVALMNITPMVIVVGAGTKAKTLGELFAEAKEKPGTLTFGSAGIGSSNHLALELLQSLAGVKLLHVPYKGSGQVIGDIIAGHVVGSIDQIASSINHIRRNQLRPLAVTSAKRSSMLPDVPTAQELGVADMQAASFTGILAPTGLPPAILAKLEAAAMKATSQPEVTKRFIEIGAEPQVLNSQEFGKFIKADLARWQGVAQRANISIE